MFPFEQFDPTQLAIVGVLLMPVVSGITQLVKSSWPGAFTGVRVRWLAIAVSAFVFALYAGVQLLPEPWSQVLTWVYGFLTFSLATSGNVDLAREVVSKASNPLNERVG